MTEAFERRAAEAMRRRKVPVESDTVIPLPDLTRVGTNDTPVDTQEAPPEVGKRFFTVMPGEVPKVPDGGDFIIDPIADPSAEGVFTYADNILRRVTPDEYAEITTITANAKTRREKGPRRLAALLPPAGPADAPPDTDAGQVVQGTNGTIDLGRLGAQAQENVRNRGRRPEPEPFLPPRERFDRRRFQLVHNSDNTTGGPNAGIPDYYVYLGPDDRPRTNPDGTEQRYTQEDVERLTAPPQAPRGWQGILQPQAARPMRNALSFLHPENATRSVDGLSMDEILGDKRRAVLFNTMIEANDRAELRDRYMEARTNPTAMSDADWTELSRQRYEFTERLKLAEESERLVTREDVAQLMATSSALAFLANSVRPERAVELIKRHTFTMFMQQSEQELAVYLDAQRRLVVIRANPKYQHMQSRVHELCNVYQITPEQLESGLVDPNIMKSMFNPGFLASFSRDVYSKKAHADLNEIDRSIHIFAQVLGMSVSQNQQLLLDTVREAAEGRRTPDIGHDAPTREEAAREEAGISTNFSTERVRAQIREPQFQARVARRYNQQSWANLTPDQREEGTFAEVGAGRDVPRRNSGGGWFGSILRSIFDALTGNARRDLRAQGAFT